MTPAARTRYVEEQLAAVWGNLIRLDNVLADDAQAAATLPPELTDDLRAVTAIGWG